MTVTVTVTVNKTCVVLMVVVLDVINIIIIVDGVSVVGGGGGGGFLGSARGDFLVFPATATDGDVTEGATFSPVTAAGFTKVTWLSK